MFIPNVKPVLAAVVISVSAITSVFGANATLSNGGSTQVADEGTENMCRQATANVEQIYDSWQSIGGGSEGQAGAFKNACAAYCKGMILGGCAQLTEVSSQCGACMH